MKNLLTLTLLALLSTTITVAQNTDSSERRLYRAKKSYHVFFDINRSVVDWSYKSNEHTLTQIKADCDSSFRNGMPAPDTVYIHSTSSPDGPEAFNSELAYQRALATKTSILNLIPEFKNSHFVIKHQVENWDALRQILLSDESFPQKEQMLKTLSDSTQAGNLHMALKQHSEGWEYYVQNHLYSLRNSAVSLSILTSRPQDEYTVAAEEYQPAVEPTKEPEPQVIEQPQEPVIALVASEPFIQHSQDSQKKKMLFAVRTNLLIPGCNVGFEFPIKDNWSIGVDYFYPWAVSKKNKWCCEMLGLFVDGKYWFTGDKYKWTKSERLQGHAVGLYGGFGYYDFQKIDKGAQGEYVDVGVDYTFGLPIANGKLRMEFNLGIGWILTYYRSYYPSSDFTDLIKDPGIIQRSTSFFGPTRASVSLLVPIRVDKNIRF